MTPPRYVFVYGTLRKGELRDITQLVPAPRLVGQATVAGVLYDLGEYPGLVLDWQNAMRVRGEVYQISGELEQQLDAIEEVLPEVGSQYRKREAPVYLGDYSSLPSTPCQTSNTAICLVYEAREACVAFAPVIASGDWVEHRVSRAL